MLELIESTLHKKLGIHTFKDRAYLVAWLPLPGEWPCEGLMLRMHAAGAHNRMLTLDVLSCICDTITGATDGIMIQESDVPRILSLISRINSRLVGNYMNVDPQERYLLMHSHATERDIIAQPELAMGHLIGSTTAAVIRFLPAILSVIKDASLDHEAELLRAASDENSREIIGMLKSFMADGKSTTQG